MGHTNSNGSSVRTDSKGHHVRYQLHRRPDLQGTAYFQYGYGGDPEMRDPKERFNCGNSGEDHCSPGIFMADRMDRGLRITD